MRIYSDLVLPLFATLPMLLIPVSASAGNTGNNHHYQSSKQYIGAGRNSYNRHGQGTRQYYGHGHSPRTYGNSLTARILRSGNVFIYPNHVTHGYSGVSPNTRTWYDTRSPSNIYYNRHGYRSHEYQQGYTDGYHDAEQSHYDHNKGIKCYGGHCGK